MLRKAPSTDPRNAPRRLSISAAILAGFVLHLPSPAAFAQQPKSDQTPGEEQTDASASDKPIVVEVRAVRDQAETSFKADRSNTATRSGGYLQEVPASVTLITSKVLETQQISNLQQALRNVSGVELSQRTQASPTNAIRGFKASATSNGVTDPSAALDSVYGVERVEVLKGPQAILSGGDSLGGGINVVTKKPQADTVRDVTVQYGSQADKTIAVDLSGAVTADNKLSYRLIGVVAEASSAIGGYDGRENRSFMPSLRWKDSNTDFIVGASYTKQHAAMPYYTFANRQGMLLDAPAMPLANRSDGFDNTDKKLYYQLEHQVTPTLVFVSRLQRSLSQIELHIPSPGELNYPDDSMPLQSDGTAMFYSSRKLDRNRFTSGDHYLRKSFNTGPVQHKLSVGYNHSDSSYSFTQWDGDPVLVQLYPTDPIDFPPIRSRTPNISSTTKFGQEQKGLYLQEMASFGDWNVLINARRTRYHTPASSTNYISIDETFVEPATTVSRTTPGLGVVYKLNPETSLYASYAQGFQPQVGLTCSGEQMPPTLTRNREVGAKLDLFDGKMSMTASLFSLQLSNKALYQFVNDCFDMRPGQRIRGTEVDVQGQLFKGLDMVFNYSYKQIKDMDDTSVVFVNEPKQKMSFWSNYAFQTPRFAGYGVGLGLSASSGLVGTPDPTYPFHIPGQAQVDASVFYNSDKLSIILGVKNLADRTLYAPSAGANFVPILPGRQFTLTLKRSFN